MPAKHRRGEIPRRLRQETVSIQILNHRRHRLVIEQRLLVGASGGEKVCRRQLHFVADHDRLLRAKHRRHGLLHENLARLVEDHDVERIHGKRQRI
jgi:hypothetical protein